MKKCRSTLTSTTDCQSQELDSTKSSFLSKLFSILSNAEISNVVSWNKDGDLFQIYDSDRFQNEVIPMYFKHKNLKSFIRQLNLHGFKKLRNKVKQVRDPLVDLYKHNFFRRDQPDLMAFIKRKITKPAEADEKVDQINSLIEKQKELQEKVKMIDQLESNDFVKMFSKSLGDKTMHLLTEALKIYTESKANESDPHKRHVYKLTEDFISNLGVSNDKAFSDEFLTAPSVATDDREELEASLLGKRTQDSWESTSISQMEDLGNPTKFLNAEKVFGCKEEFDFDTVLTCNFGLAAEVERWGFSLDTL
jgi:hypothetical protein